MQIHTNVGIAKEKTNFRQTTDVNKDNNEM